jgi:hypothetical protein
MLYDIVDYKIKSITVNNDKMVIDVVVKPHVYLEYIDVTFKLEKGMKDENRR